MNNTRKEMKNDIINLNKDEEKKIKKVRSIQTLFRNAARSNLELTSLADSKASILISLNGFILTVIVTASGLQMNHPIMIFPFISIILTSLLTISLAIKAIQPRYKQHFVSKGELENHNSILYFQDAVNGSAQEYLDESLKVIESTELTHKHIIRHLHILSSEIKIKYRWLRFAYITFAAGLVISVLLVIYALIMMTNQA